MNPVIKDDTFIKMKTISGKSPGNIGNSKLIIFDLDGTLYDQRKLHVKMFYTFFCMLIRFQMNLKDLQIISSFRKQRENHKGYESHTLDKDQIFWCSNELGLPPYLVRQKIEHYMYTLPLKFIKIALYKGVEEYIQKIHNRGLKIAVYSDYPVDDKLRSLGLSVDKTFCSTDESIHCLKPNGNALLTICRYFDVDRSDTVYFGDREETDGESAKMAGIKFIHIDIRKARRGIFYTDLLQELG